MLRAVATPAPRPPPALPRRRSPVPADISGHPVQITDPRGVLLQVQTFDLLGRPLFTGAADEGHGATAGAGETRVAPDAAGAPLRVWRSGGLTLRHTHDALRRPIGLFVDAGAGERLVTRSFYGEALSDAPAHSRGRPVRVYDTAGELRLAHDFRGRVATQTREVLADVTAEADWSDLDAATSLAGIDAALATLGALSGEGFAVETAHDALDRVTEQTAPDGSRTVPGYDAGGRLTTVDVHVRGASAATAFISAIAYNARGQRTGVVYGNHTSTTFTYDPQRFWLARLGTIHSHALGGGDFSAFHTRGPNRYHSGDELKAVVTDPMHVRLTGSVRPNKDGKYTATLVLRTPHRVQLEEASVDPRAVGDALGDIVGRMEALAKVHGFTVRMYTGDVGRRGAGPASLIRVVPTISDMVLLDGGRTPETVPARIPWEYP